jgi:hypothetical protein
MEITFGHQVDYLGQGMTHSNAAIIYLIRLTVYYRELANSMEQIQIFGQLHKKFLAVCGTFMSLSPLVPKPTISLLISGFHFNNILLRTRYGQCKLI